MRFSCWFKVTQNWLFLFFFGRFRSFVIQISFYAATSFEADRVMYFCQLLPKLSNFFSKKTSTLVDSFSIHKVSSVFKCFFIRASLGDHFSERTWSTLTMVSYISWFYDFRWYIFCGASLIFNVLGDSWLNMVYLLERFDELTRRLAYLWLFNVRWIVQNIWIGNPAAISWEMSEQVVYSCNWPLLAVVLNCWP